ATPGLPPGPSGHREGAAGHPLVPGGVPVDGAAVAQLGGPRGVDDLDDVAPLAEVVEPGGVVGRQVHTAMRDVGVALGAHRPRRRVHELATVADVGVLGHVLVVAVGRVAGDAHRLGVHHHVGLLGQHHVHPAHGRVLVPPGAVLEGLHDGAVVGHRHGVGGDVDGADVDVAHGEAHAAVGPTPDPVAGVDPGQVGGERHVLTGGPVGLGPVADLLGADPVPGPEHRRRHLHVERPLHRRLVGHRLVELHHDGHAHAPGAAGRLGVVGQGGD